MRSGKLIWNRYEIGTDKPCVYTGPGGSDTDRICYLVPGKRSGGSAIGTLSKLTSGQQAAVNKQISIQKDSRPSEFSRPLTSITLKLNGDLNVTASSRPPRQFA